METAYVKDQSGLGTEVLLPRRIGHIEFVDIIGRGGNAVVYKGRDVRDGSVYACKAFNRRNVEDDFGMFVLEQELRANELLQNPHLVKIHSTLYTDKVIVLVMELCPRTLLSMLTTGFSLSVDRAKHFFCQILLALEYLHRRNVSHGDIKPDNLMFDEMCNLKLGDFGCVHMDANTIYQGTGGTLFYMAPECFDPKPRCDRRPADVWALGIVFYCMITCRLPWAEGTDEDLISNIRESEIYFPCGFPPDVEDIVRRCCAKEPKDRITVPELVSHPFLADQVQLIREMEGQTRSPILESMQKKRVHIVKPIRQIHNVKAITPTVKKPESTVASCLRRRVLVRRQQARSTG